MSSQEIGNFSSPVGCVARFLRKRHPIKTPEAVEDETRGAVSAAQVRKWLGGNAVPSFPAALALLAAYGPEMLIEVMSPAPLWLRKAAREQRLADLAAEQQRLEAEFERLGGA